MWHAQIPPSFGTILGTFLKVIKHHRHSSNHDIELIAKLNVYPKAKQFPFMKYFKDAIMELLFLLLILRCNSKDIPADTIYLLGLEVENM